MHQREMSFSAVPNRRTKPGEEPSLEVEDSGSLVNEWRLEEEGNIESDGWSTVEDPWSMVINWHREEEDDIA